MSNNMLSNQKFVHNSQQPEDENSSVLQRVQRDFIDHNMNIENLMCKSEALAESFNNARHCRGENTMLPSFIGELPQFQEDRGFLALDIGGSTMRAALVQIKHGEHAPPPRVIGLQSWSIDRDLRMLSGMTFLRWIAARVQLILRNVNTKRFWHPDSPIPIGLTWSFPFRQTSADDGYILKTGKGFRCVYDLVGQKLNRLFQTALKAEGLDVNIFAIVNDAISGFLAHEYRAENMQISMILGTGLNAAIRLPASALRGKHLISHFLSHFPGWERIIVNTELSLFGENIVEQSIWDKALQAQIRSSCHQPLEYVCGGLYLGEIMRLVIIDAIHESTLFHGQMPLGLQKEFSLDLPLAALFEDDTSSGICEANLAFSAQFPLPDSQRPSSSDFEHIRQIVRATSRRAAAYIAVSIHALRSHLKPLTADNGEVEPVMSIGITGSVLTKYPNFANICHGYLSEMLAATEDGVTVVFNESECPTIIGAALAAYIIDQKQKVRSPVVEPVLLKARSGLIRCW